MELSGSPFDFLIAFLAGCLASLTPCVYPLIPISAGYIVGNAKDSQVKAFKLSLAYVSGMAITYSGLGILAVMTGNIFGKFSLNPQINLLSGVLIVIFGLVMFDLFPLNFTARLKLPVYKKINFWGAFLLGLVSAFMITPCLTPILGSILAYLSTKNNIFYGGLLLLSFAYGMGLIFILVGTFGAGLAGLPKSGKWMVAVKKVCAAVMVSAGLFIIITAIRRF
jgi:thiol:disulfide interchange protein DsbD